MLPIDLYKATDYMHNSGVPIATWLSTGRFPSDHELSESNSKVRAQSQSNMTELLH